MPTINLPIDDVMSSVERPIVFDIVRQLMLLTGISEKTPVRFYGDDATGAQWGSYLTKHSKSQNLWPHLENLKIEVEEDFDPDRMLSMSVKENDHAFIFHDRSIGFSIKPAFSTSRVTIRVIYNAKDKNQASRWRNEVRSRTDMGREINLHTLSYSYHLPEIYQVLIAHIFDLKSAIGSNGDTLQTYWARCASPKFTKVVDQAGGNPILVVADRQAKIQGLFDFEGAPERSQKEDEPDLWSVSFGYKFTYEKPINTVCRYPLLVHQQLIGERFRLDNAANPTLEVMRALTLTDQNLEPFKGDVQIARRLANKGVTIPHIDDWLPREGTVPTGTVKLFTALTSITVEDRRTLMNLRELGEFSLVQDVLDFMAQSEYPYLCGHSTSIFQITVYENHNVLYDDDVMVDDNLNVVATRDLDLTKVYHVRLGMQANLIQLTSSAVARLRAWPNLIERFAAALNGALTQSGGASDLRKNSLNAHDLAILGMGPRVSSSYGWSLMQTLFVCAMRMQDVKKEPIVLDALERPFISI